MKRIEPMVRHTLSRGFEEGNQKNAKSGIFCSTGSNTAPEAPPRPPGARGIAPAGRRGPG
jgi:hypothetical protein